MLRRELSPRERWLEAEIKILRARLKEADVALKALREGKTEPEMSRLPNGDPLLSLMWAARWYRTFVESINDGALVVFGDGIVFFANRRFTEMVQAPESLVLGSHLGEWMPPEDREAFDALLRGGGAGNSKHEVTLCLSDGSRLPVSCSVSPMDAGDLPTFSILVSDLSETKRNEEIVASELLARSILSQVAEAIVVCDESGTIIRTSHEADRLTGGSALFQPFETALPLVLSDGTRFPLASVMQGEILQGFEVSLQRQSFPQIHLLLSAGPLHGADGRLLGCVITLIDITPRKRFEAMLRQQSEALASSNAALKQFAYVASHDLQEPLRMISHYVTLLGNRYRGKLDSDADDFIRFASEGAVRIHTQLNDLLDYSRVDTSEISRSPVDCRSVARVAMNNLRSVAEEQGASITFGELPWVNGDSDQLIQLFQNIIDNAIKFRGSSPPRIQVEAVSKGGFWRFSVRDNGIGMEPEYLDRIFTIFQRLHTRAEYSGNGIGLAICKRIVERHGGSIWVSSAPGQGATFYFTLPMADGPAWAPEDRPPSPSADHPPSL